jgi:hypothetical protein
MWKIKGIIMFAIVAAMILSSDLCSAADWELCERRPNSCCCCYGTSRDPSNMDCRMKYSEDCKRTGGGMIAAFDPEAARLGKTRCKRCW